MKKRLVTLAAIGLLAFVGTASAADDYVLYEGTIWAGQTINVGPIAAILHYTNSDNATLEIKYGPLVPPWIIEEVHVHLLAECPESRPSPGQAPFKYEDINDDEYSVYITIAQIRALGFDWGDEICVVPHCAVYNPATNEEQTGYGGTVRGRWFACFCIDFDEPEKGPDPEPWDGETRTIGFWKHNTSPGFRDPNRWGFDWDDYFPVTLSGYNIANVEAAYQTFVAARANPMWLMYIAQYLATYCNTVRDPLLLTAYYNDDREEGEWMEDWQVDDIFDAADDPDNYTNELFLAKTKDVFDAINNSWEGYGVLWTNPLGPLPGPSPTAGNKPILGALTVSPNPVQGRAVVALPAGVKNGRVAVYDLSGNKVRELTGASDRLAWDGTDANGRKLAAGVYVLQLESEAGVVGTRAVLCR